jgi:uncharacterized protein YndB with AHSA1/START domain
MILCGDGMNIDQNAPLAARREIFINMPPEKVWAVLADIAHWPEWQTDIASVKLEGEVRPGTVFRWKASGLNITSTLRDVEAPRRIGWTGDSLGMKAIHNWTFEAQESGTRAITEESLSGWLARLLKLFDAHFLEKSLEKSLIILKNRAEKE